MSILIKNKSELDKILGHSAVITVNNELLYYYYDFLSDPDVCCTIDGFYLQKYLNLYSKNKIHLIIGKDIYDYFLTSSQKVLIIGGDDNRYDKENMYPYVRKKTPQFPNESSLNEWLHDNTQIFNEFDVVFVMFTGQYQMRILEYAHKIKSKATFIGLGGTLDQVFGYQNIPEIMHKIGLVWLYRTIFYFDRTKLKKLLVSFEAFIRYNGFRQRVLLHEDK